jgi:hypothetical protein
LADYVQKSTSSKIPEYLVLYSPSKQFLKSSRELTPEIEKKFTNLVKPQPKGSKIRVIESLKNGELIISGRQIMNEAGELGAVLLLGEKLKLKEPKEGRISPLQQELQKSRPFKKILKWSFISP